jgi:hypothetical protein
MMTHLRLFLVGVLLLVLSAAAALPVLALARGYIHLGTLNNHATRTEPLLIIGGDASLPSGATAPLMVMGGTLHLNGTATDVVIGLDADLVLGPRAVLAADVVDLDGSIYRAPSAQVHGNTVSVIGPLWTRSGSRSAGLLQDAHLAALTALSVFVLALLLSAAFPWRVLIVAATVRRYSWQSLAVASVGLVGLPLVCVPLLLSLVGLPLALLLLLAAFGLWVMGVAGAGLLIGHRLLVICGTADSLLRSTFLGLLVLVIVGLIPRYGLLVLLGLGCLGAGATVLSLVDRARTTTMIMANQSSPK